MRSVLWTCVVVTGLALASWPATALARIAIVETTGGRTFEGELLSETDDAVVLMISNIETSIQRSDIESITFKKSGAELYAQRRAALEDDDLDGRFGLAYDMYEMGELDLARQETRALREAFPDAERVKRLDGVITDAIRLREDRGADAAAARPAAEPDETAAPRRGGEDRQSLREQQLTDEQINLIRLWELPVDLEELQPRIVIPRQTIDKLLDEYADRDGIPRGRSAQNEFRRGQGWQQLPFFFDVRARELYPQIRVVEDPPAMRTFRTTIYPLYVRGYFSRTFGEGDIEGLRLFGGRGDQLRVAYTDFYILHSYREGHAYMIDRDKPEESLLLQWGLPRDQARYKAPDVPGWRPFFTGEDDPQFIQIRDWIDSLYKSVDYGIDYTPPAPDAADAE